jgi:hypothetical protein
MLIETATGRIHLREYHDVTERDIRPGFYADVAAHLQARGACTIPALIQHFGCTKLRMVNALGYLGRAGRVSESCGRWRATR